MEHSAEPVDPSFSPLVGTASWSDKTLRDCGEFYPPTAKTPEARLRFYASQFNLVEVDTSYYAIPAVTTAQHWAERTPAGFVFNVKAFSLFTGQWTSSDVFPKDIKEALGTGRRLVYKDMAPEYREELWKRFMACLAPLQVNDKLGLVHFQSTHPDHALLRLHGRNEVAYGKPAKTAAERFDYAYTSAELQGLAKRFSPIARSVRYPHAVFNNCMEDKSKLNAKEFLEVLKGSFSS